MYRTVNFTDFVDAFRGMGRENRFTYEGKQALFDYLVEMELDTREPIELDVIGLCCEFTEYESLAQLQEDYPDIESMEELEDYTTVIPIDGTDGFIISNF